MVDRIVGFYSFPKSGNTWMRHILGKSIGSENSYQTVPDIYTDPIWDNPVQVGDRQTVFYKSHSKDECREAYGRSFANDLVVYIVRHPLDVFLSQLNFVSDNVTSNPNIMLQCASVDDVVARGDLDLYFGAFCVFGTLQPQFADAGSWFTNALNWNARAEAEPDRVMVIRYEDMLEQGPAALADFAARVELTMDDLQNGFDLAKAQTKPDGKFFWKQKAENYLDLLSEEMIARFSRLHRDKLAKFGYADG